MNRTCLFCGSENIEYLKLPETKKYKAIHICNDCRMGYADTFEHDYTKADAENYLEHLKNNDTDKYKKYTDFVKIRFMTVT